MQTIQQFIKSAGITGSVRAVDRNPHMEDNGYMRHHWRVTLRAGKNRMSVVFSMGVGLEGREPRICEVLDTLAGDGVDCCTTFDDWCEELGFDTDSRRAYAIYRACRNQSQRLCKMLGESAYKALLYDTERL